MRLFIQVALLFGLVAHSWASPSSAEQIRVNDVVLTYTDVGTGPPIVLLHGGLGDYTSWQPQMEALSRHFRVIAYSRRYAYPNQNHLSPEGWTIATDVRDLAALLKALSLERPHLIGQSAGGFVALAFALDHPDKVRSLTLSEPPVHQLIRTSREGEAAYQQFLTEVWIPAGVSFREHDVQSAMRVFIDGISGAPRFASFSDAAKAANLRNAATMEAHALSSDPFPRISPAQLQHLTIPTLIITGANTIRIHSLVDHELARLLPGSRSVTIPNSGHGSPRENPAAFNAAVLQFLQ